MNNPCRNIVWHVVHTATHSAVFKGGNFKTSYRNKEKTISERKEGDRKKKKEERNKKKQKEKEKLSWESFREQQRFSHKLGS